MIDRIAIIANVDVQTAGSYKFGATLAASNEIEVKNNTVVNLETGSQQIPLYFSADQIRALEVDGPYKIKDAILFFQDSDGNHVADYRADAGNTAAYSLATLDSAAKPDLLVTSEASPAPVEVGATLTYTLIVYNIGITPATDVVVTDQLPSGVTFSSAQASQGSCSQVSPIVCNLQTLPGESSATVTIVVVPTAPATLTNAASVTSSTTESNANNNTTTLNTTVVPPTVTTAVFVATDGTTQGNWKGSYGSDGYNIINDTENYPAYAEVFVASHRPFTWIDPTNDVRALQKAASSDRIASGWYSNSNFTVDLKLVDAQPHRVALYVMDWDLISLTTRQAISLPQAILTGQSLPLPALVVVPISRST